MIVIFALISLVWLLLFLRNLLAFYDLPWLNVSSPLKPLSVTPFVSIVIAARNEAAVIERALQSLKNLDYPAFEIIVVDDGSTDETVAIVCRMVPSTGRLLVVRGTELPPGWVGKSWALHQGVRRARGEWLLFTDADCVHHPLSLRSAMNVAIESGWDGVSLIPRLEGFTISAKLILPAYVALLGTLFPLGALNRRPKNALAAGGFLLLRRSVYQAVGGHEAIKSSLLDDVSLARRVKAGGFSFWTGLTRDLVVTRGYESFSAIWQTLARHAFDLLGQSVGKVVVFSLVLFGLTGTPIVGAVSSLASVQPLALMLCLLPMVVMMLLGVGSTRLLGIRWGWGLFLPLGVLVYGMLVIDAVIRYHRGDVIWSGRRYGRG